MIKSAVNFALVFSAMRNRESAFSRLRIALNTNAKFTADLSYFFYNFFIFSQWPLIFDIIKFLSIPTEIFQNCGIQFNSFSR